jgi:hypothetical protein
VTRTFDLTGFDRIDVAGVYELEVTVGPDFSVEMSGPEEEMNRVETSIEDGVLTLGQRKRERGERRLRRRDGVEARITMPALHGVDVSGVVEADFTGIVSDEFSVDLSGVGELDLDGECGALTARVSGVGELDAEGLECKSAMVRVSGVGEAAVYATDAVEAHISGMGEIDIYGSPANVEKHSGMFSDITVH